MCVSESASNWCDANDGLRRRKKFSNSQFCLLKQHQKGKTPAGSHCEKILCRVRLCSESSVAAGLPDVQRMAPVNKT